MKIFFVLAITMLGLSASAAPTLDGNWVLSERACTDGAAPNDKFNPSTDSMKITFKQGTLAETVTFGGCTMNASTSYKTNGLILTTGAGSLTSTCAPASSFEASTGAFYVTDTEMIMFNAGFGDGGSCARGQGIVLKFTKVP